MLHDFISTNHDELILRTRAKVASRPWPPAYTEELGNGVPLFLSQLSETLRLEGSWKPFSPSAIGAAATKHGRDRLGMGFTVSQVVDDYGDVCQAITELAVEKDASISTGEFQTLNRCLDTAIAGAVTEFGRLKTESTSHDEVERLGRLTHELQSQIQTALVSFRALKAGTAGVGGSTGAVLGRSLVRLRDLVDRALYEIHLAATPQQREQVSLLVFIDEVAVAAMRAEYRNIQLTVEPVDPRLTINVYPELLAAALMTLLQNALKYTHKKGHVTLRTRAENERVFVEVEDECGGMAQPHPLPSIRERRGIDRHGFGLGLSISRKAIEVNGGEFHLRNVPGKGCIFTIELPMHEHPAR